MENRFKAALLAGVVLFSPAAHAVYTLGPMERIPMSAPFYFGSPPVVADFTGDLQDDIVVAGSTSEGDRIFVVSGSGGGFTESVAYDCAANGTFCLNNPIAVDVDNDGLMDLAVVETAFGADNSTIAILHGDGHGLLHRVASLPNPDHCQPNAFADFNGDGNADMLAVCGTLSFVNRIWLGDGAGGFVEGDAVLGGQFYRATAVDWNGDGAADLLYVDSNRIQLYLNDLAGGFSLAQSIDLPPVSFASYLPARIGDFNGDGRVDATVLTLSTGADVPVYAKLFLQDTGGAMQEATPLTLPAQAAGLAVADLDHDGRTDVLAGDGYSQELGLYLNGAGGFAPAVSYATGWNAIYTLNDHAVGDVDGDGCRDVVMYEGGVGLNVFRGICAAPAPSSTSVAFTWRHVTSGFVFGLKNTDRHDLVFTGNVRVTLTLRDDALTPIPQTSGCTLVSRDGNAWSFSCRVPPLPARQTHSMGFYVDDALQRERTMVRVHAEASSLVLGDPVLGVFDRQVPVSLNAYRGHH